jgi:hypothetical protein
VLDPDAVNLGQLCAALDDHTPGTTWWIDPGTGEIRTRMEEVPSDFDPAAAGWIQITPTETHESYRDMADFVAAVQHRRAADLLDRAISGRGAFRRFKNTLFEFPELRDQWFRFRDARGRRRAARWLAETGLVTRADAERTAAAHPDPSQDEEDLPTAVAVDLAMLYGDRLEQVFVTGGWARPGDVGEADLELLVVLSEVRSAWEELERMDAVLWRHTERARTAVTAHPVTRAELADPATPALARAAAGAVLLA